MSVPNVVIIGAGNVASHIAPAIVESGAGNVVQVYSRTLHSSSALASKLPDAVSVDRTDDILIGADIYIISVSDDAIPSLVSRLSACDALWLHTSGSVGMDVLSTLSDRYGVFYPLQTFSLGVDLDVNRVPLFIEGSSADVENDIRCFGAPVFENIYHADSDMRRMMHVAAVFGSNFVNYLWSVAADMLNKEGLPFDVLRPLLEETMRKAFACSPFAGQTGPAVRGDRHVMDRHLSMLDGNEKMLYRIISDCIMEHHNRLGHN